MGRSLHALVESIIHQAEGTWPRHKNIPTRKIVASTPPEFLPNVNKNGSSKWNLTPGGISYSALLNWPGKPRTVRPVTIP